MNNKFGTLLSVVVILFAIAIWSTSVLAAEPDDVEAPDRTIDAATVRLAVSANEEAVREASRSIQKRNRLDLDIRLVAATSSPLAAK